MLIDVFMSKSLHLDNALSTINSYSLPSMVFDAHPELER